MDPVNVSGKLVQPYLLTITAGTPSIAGWTAKFVMTWEGTDPTNEANQFAVDAPWINGGRAAGPIYSAPGADGISIPHSFSIECPTSIRHFSVWLVAGMMNAAGVYEWNPIVPGLTPQCVLTAGATTGTVDASAVIRSSIASSMAVVDGLFGVAAAGITNPLLGPGAVATINIEALAVTNPLLAALSVAAGNMQSNSVTAGNGALAALAVQASNLAGSSVTATAIANAAVGSAAISALAVGTGAIQTAAITEALIANLAVSAAKMQNATITSTQIASATIAQGNLGSLCVGTAQIQDLAVTNAKIASLDVSKLNAGTVAVSVSLTSASLICPKNGVTTTIDNLVDSDLSGYIGVKVLEGSSNNYSYMWAGGFATVPGGSINVVSLGKSGLGTYGVLTLRDVTGASINAQVIIDSHFGTVKIGSGLTPTTVLKTRQAGPGNPSFNNLNAAQTWCQTLYNALGPSGHGLLT